MTFELIVIGRYGDILNCLPIAYAFHKRGAKLKWLVGQEHAAILSGVSYVEVEEWDGSQDTLVRAIRYVNSQGHRPLIAQAWQNPDQRHLTDSFAKEQWRLAGLKDQYGKYPLVIDRRVPIREEVLVRSYGLNGTRTPRRVILVSTASVSTPYKYADKLIATIRGMDAEIIDMDHVRVRNVYDLLGLYERADCLVSVDTMHHHLARASYLPVVYLQNDGWKGAPPVPQVRASWRYSDLADLNEVKSAAEKVVSKNCHSVQVVVHTYPQGHCDRHERAMATHPKDSIYAVFDHRPKMKELLGKAIESGKDGVFFTNDDVAFLPDTIDRVKAHLSKWDFGCSRRPRDPVHIGRECFFFRTDWMKEHWDEIPDPYWSVQKPDLILCRWLRKQMGIPTTMENLNYDFAPVEIPAGLIQHEDHPSHWCGEAEQSMEGLYNEKLWKELA